MINKNKNPAEWALLMYEFDDLIEHLQDLQSAMIKQGSIGEADYEVRVGHCYSHLNQIWNSRNRASEQTDE
jgi:hypothetical protein